MLCCIAVVYSIGKIYFASGIIVKLTIVIGLVYTVCHALPIFITQSHSRAWHDTPAYQAQGDHWSGKPGNVREFETCQGNVRDFVNSQGIVREMSGKNLVMEKCPKTVHY